MTTSAPASVAQRAIAGPGTPSRSPMAITFLPFSSIVVRPPCDGVTRVRASSRAGIALQYEGETVRHLRHAPEEQAALGHEEHALERPGGEAVDAMGEERDGGGDVALGRREAGHAAFDDEAREILTSDLAARDRQCGEQAVVEKGHVAAPGRLGRLRVVEFRRVAIDV